MRNPNRIPICLKLLFPNITLSKFLGDYPEHKHIKCGYAKRIHENWELIEKTWKEYPDLRFGQLLCNLRLIPDLDVENHIWNIEEDDWLIKNGYCNIEDIKFWGSIYDEHNHKRKEIEFILLKNLTNSHIRGILKWFDDQNALDQINKKYLEYFNKRLDE